jgi:hypothetical protein
MTKDKTTEKKVVAVGDIDKLSKMDKAINTDITNTTKRFADEVTFRKKATKKEAISEQKAESKTHTLYIKSDAIKSKMLENVGIDLNKWVNGKSDAVKKFLATKKASNLMRKYAKDNEGLF